MLVADYLDRTGVDWNLKISRQSLVIEIKEKKAIAQQVADDLLENCLDFLAQSAANLHLEDTRIRWSKKQGHEHRIPAFLSDSKFKGEYCMSLSAQNPNSSIWFGGIYSPELRPFLDRMGESDKPTGLVLPVISGNSVIRTIQWGINRASIELFGFDSMSVEDMQAAIQRDTTGDWFAPDLEEKRRLYENAGTEFEQVARIRTKAGWIKVHFQCERIDVGNLVLSRGRQVSEVAEAPDLLALI
jgi:hypothetical protein